VAPRRNISESRFGREWRLGAELPEPAGPEGAARADALDSPRDPLHAALAILESILVDGRGAGRASDVLLQAAGASECLVALWQGDGQPTVLASRGDLGLGSRELFSFFAPIDRAGRTAPALRDGYGGQDSEYWCCGYRAPGTELAACVVRERPVAPVLAALCRVLVLAVAAEEARRGDSLRPRPPLAEAAAAAPAAGAPGFAPAVSPAMRRVYSLVAHARKGGFPVLVVGETGAGKEHVVRLLHERSVRSAAPFVAVNCAAIPAELLEAELFGVARGAATGVQERTGRVQQAAGGTLFLDEIGEMPLSLQPKLLRMLDSGEVCPVGGTPHRVETRFVAATNVDLEARIRGGAFRADLYYRLAGFQIDVPPLRDRREDVPVLLEHFLERFANEADRHVRGFTLKALGALRAYDWPGNVRELEGEVRRLVYVCPEGAPIEWGMLAARVRARTDAAHEPAPLDLAAQVRSLEERLIRAALEHSRGHRGEAARMLGISRNWLAIKLRRLGAADGADA
jgi:DNA-binding NtrC family response regulator